LIGKAWTANEELRLREIYPVKPQRECARLLGRSRASVAAHAKVLQIRRIRENYKQWTSAEDEKLRKEYPNAPSENLAKLFSTTKSAVYQRAERLGLRKSAEYMASPAACRLRRGDEVGKASRFQKGIVPHNKGLRRPGYSIGRGRMSETTFKKGERRGTAAQNWKPIGTICPDTDGYLRKKVSEGVGGYGNQKAWEFVHIRTWIDANGPVPSGHAIVFKDGINVQIENLECISRAELMRRNSIHARRSPEMKEAIYGLIQVKRLITMREKKRANKKQAERSAGSPVRDARSAQG
jgi:hypothetical protein